MSDGENTTLVNLFKAGDKEAFDTLYYKYNALVLRNIRRFVRSQQDAEDILQEVFVTLWQKRDSIDSNRSLAGWLMVLSHNKALDLLQKRVREKLLQLPDFPECFAQIQENNVDYKINIEFQLSHLEKVINSLPPKQQEAFTLCKLQAKTYAQASRVLGISPHTVREYVSIAMEKIRGHFSDINVDTLFMLLLTLAMWQY